MIRSAFFVLLLSTAMGCGAPGSSTGAPDAGSATCPADCGANRHCATGSCVCDDGLVPLGSGCVRSTSPAKPLTKAEVCDLWIRGHEVSAEKPFVASGSGCSPGALAQSGLDDTMKRLNMFRILEGLLPASNGAALNPGAQRCAVIAAWNTPGLSAHHPAPTAKCFDADGAAAAGESNISWGARHPAKAIDDFMQDQGNDSTLGHRRWILNPPLDPVGVGYYEGGDNYGSTECLQIFGTKGGGARPAFYAFPPAGFVPEAMAQWTWSLHAPSDDVVRATVTVQRVGDGASLAVTVRPLSQGYGDFATSFVPSGWKPVAGETYRVTVTGLAQGTLTYDVSPVSCP